MHRHEPRGSLCALLLVAALPLQQAVAQSAGESPTAPSVAAQAEYRELVAAYTKASREFERQRVIEIEAARAAGQPRPAPGAPEPIAEWLPKFQAGADKWRGTDGAVPFLVWIGTQSLDTNHEAVLATLLTDHLQSPEFGAALPLVTRQRRARGKRNLDIALMVRQQNGEKVVVEDDGQAEAREALVRQQLATILAGNPHPNVKAQTLLARANLVFESDTGIDLESRAKVDPARRPAALDDIRQAALLATDTKLKAQLDRLLHVHERLIIGVVAPEIEGPDLDGVTFKLSDYRGKVVLLNFWGYW